MCVRVSLFHSLSSLPPAAPCSLPPFPPPPSLSFSVSASIYSSSLYLFLPYLPFIVPLLLSLSVYILFPSPATSLILPPYLLTPPPLYYASSFHPQPLVLPPLVLPPAHVRFIHSAPTSQPDRGTILSYQQISYLAITPH